MTLLRVSFAGPLVSFQDAGRPGNMRFGVPASGPMDRIAHAAANLAVGNDAGATAIEVSLGGLVIDVVGGALTVGIAGGAFDIELNGTPLPAWTAVTPGDGDRLAIRPGRRGSWAYLAVAGRLDVPSWLGHTATHSMSGFGGGVLAAGDEYVVADARIVRDRDGEIPMPDIRPVPTAVGVVIGPQEHHFEPAAVRSLTTSTYALTDAYDRMGVRLDGPPLPLSGALSIPSEAIVRGSVQVTGDGVPTVLLADHQTTGGYPKIATVISSDLDRFAQLRAGDEVDFEPVTPSEAVRRSRSDAADRDRYLATVAGPGRTLTHRLRHQNLIGGAVLPPASS